MFVHESEIVPDYLYQLLVEHTAAGSLRVQAQDLLVVAFPSVARRLWSSPPQTRLFCVKYLELSGIQL